MTRRSRSVLSAALFVLALAPRTSAQSVDDLVARNIQAKGGAEKMKAVTTVRQTGHLSMQGMEGSMMVYSKRPNLLRQEITLGSMTVVNAFDGENAWMVNPLVGSSDPVVMGGTEADMIRDQSSFDGPLSDYKAKGSTLELVGEETLDGRKVEHLKLTGRNQLVQHIYLDAQTSLEVRMVLEVRMASGAETGSFTQDLSDYRVVDGIKVPFVIKTSANGVPMGQITVDSIEFNVAIDDALFRMKMKRSPGEFVTAPQKTTAAVQFSRYY
jgi:outer membrane lipoprotein-sorting protein